MTQEKPYVPSEDEVKQAEEYADLTQNERARLMMSWAEENLSKDRESILRREKAGFRVVESSGCSETQFQHAKVKTVIAGNIDAKDVVITHTIIIGHEWLGEMGKDLYGGTKGGVKLSEKEAKEIFRKCYPVFPEERDQYEKRLEEEQERKSKKAKIKK